MSTFLTNTATNDLYLDAAMNIAISNTRIQEIQQLINNKLQTFLGEIETNLDEGVDYFGTVFNQYLPITSRVNEIIARILEVTGVVGVINIDYAENNDGIMNLTFTIQTDVGNITLVDIPLYM